MIKIGCPLLSKIVGLILFFKLSLLFFFTVGNFLSACAESVSATLQDLSPESGNGGLKGKGLLRENGWGAGGDSGVREWPPNCISSLAW